MGSQTRVQILNREYVITGDLEAEYIKSLAGKINDRLSEINANLPKKPEDLHLLILLAMNLMDELELNHAKSSGSADDEIQKKTSRLITMLEKGIIG